MTPAERRAVKNAKDRERRARIKAGTWDFPMNGEPAKALGGNYARAAARRDFLPPIAGKAAQRRIAAERLGGPYTAESEREPQSSGEPIEDRQRLVLSDRGALAALAALAGVAFIAGAALWS
jgi:hypothetical protein